MSLLPWIYAAIKYKIIKSNILKIKALCNQLNFRIKNIHKMSILQQTQMDFKKYNIELKFSLEKNVSLEIKKLLNTIMCHLNYLNLSLHETVLYRYISRLCKGEKQFKKNYLIYLEISTMYRGCQSESIFGLSFSRNESTCWLTANFMQYFALLRWQI